MTASILDRINELQRQGRAFCVLTVVRTAHVTSAKAGAKALVTQDGELIGHIGGGCVQGAARRAAAAALEEGAARLIRVKPGDEVVSPFDADGVELHKSGCPSGGTVDIFVEPYVKPAALVILGDSPAATALARLGRGLGLRILHAAPEEPGAVEADRAVACYDLSALEVAEGDFVVVAAQGRRDLDALREAALSPARSVSMIASRKKASTLSARLAERGVPAERLARVKAPAGLDIGAIDPEEIALSILAEIVQTRRARMRRAVGAVEQAS